jgi:sialic acid synthase SpsE
MNKTFIIAEAGVNHNGSIDIAKKMIEVAKECGADAIKFQTFKAENIISKIDSIKNSWYMPTKLIENKIIPFLKRLSNNAKETEYFLKN